MPLTLGELRAKLADFDHLPDDTKVVMSKDGEGGSFSPLCEIEEGMYLAETTYSGERYMTNEQRQAMEHLDDYSEAPDGATLALFLWPVN